MAERGDVLQLKRRIGFGRDQEGERFVVVQATALNSALPTMLVVPLDPHVALFSSSPLAVRVSATEAGASADHVAVSSWIHVLHLDRVVPGRVGRLKRATLDELDDRLRRVLDL